MMTKIWSRMGLIGTITLIVGLGLTIFRINFGEYILIIGLVVSAVGKIGSIVHMAKKPPRCPHCGALLQNYTKRVRKGGLFSESSDIVTCGHCGAEVDLIKLYKSNNL